MNAVNRVLVVIILLVSIVACSVLLVGSRWVLPAFAYQLDTLIETIQDLEWYQLELPGGLIALLVDLVIVVFIFFEVRRPSRSIRVEKAAGGEVQISVASIADRLKYEVDQLPSVLRTKPKVSAKRGGVVVEMDVETSAGVNVPEKAEQIVETARQVVEEDMGLKLVRPKVNLRVVPHPKTRKPSARPREVPAAKPKERPPAEPKEELHIEPPIEPPVEPPIEPGEPLNLPEGWGEM
ncbi:MAG: alkaline shock response membrane anchor protein AmaP [Chloroflexota bacterium]|nr:alkaline shock response membrane anchor protein AmaP [Chloroflexota bacterium]